MEKRGGRCLACEKTVGIGKEDEKAAEEKEKKKEEYRKVFRKISEKNGRPRLMAVKRPHSILPIIF